MHTEDHAMVRVLLKQNKAKRVQKNPFTIQMLYENVSCTQKLDDAGKVSADPE